MFKFYEVGGKVRDELLGLTNKDIDYVAVPCDEALKEKLEDNEFYFGSNEFHEFSFKDIIGTFEKAESISEEERDTICQLFGDSRGLTFTDEVLDIIGVRNV